MFGDRIFGTGITLSVLMYVVVLFGMYGLKSFVMKFCTLLILNLKFPSLKTYLRVRLFVMELPSLAL